MKNLFIIFLIVFTGMQLSAQKPDRITGIWWNDEKTSKIEIKKEANGSYSGTILYLIPERYENGQPPKDKKNPDPALSERTMLGLTIFFFIHYDGISYEFLNGVI